MGSNASCFPGALQRRSVLGLGALSALSLACGVPRVWAQTVPAGRQGLDGGRLVVVFLRGAYDGLSALVPYADTDYYAMRPNIAIAAPDGTAQTGIRLDRTFALHPALSALMPLWQQGVLGFVPAAGLPAPNRSHFDAQYQMEIAQSGKTSSAPGWLNNTALLAKTSPGSAAALGVGEVNPAILGGQAAVRLIPRGQSAERTGVLANDRTRQALLDLYAGDDKISEAFRQGAGSRMQSAQELTMQRTERAEQIAQDSRRMADKRLDRDGTPANPQAQTAQMLAASNGAADPVGLQLDAQHLGTLMRNDRKLRLGFLSAGGWDTHANQGAVSGQLANNFGNLARGIAQLRRRDRGDE
jgi:uncharacterized protein (DUF1501 family)